MWIKLTVKLISWLELSLEVDIGVNDSFGCFYVVIASGKGLDDGLDEVGLGFGYLLHGPDDDFVPSDTEIILVMDLFVLIGVLILFVLEVPMLGTDSHGNSLIIDTVLDNCPEELVSRSIYFYYSRSNGSQYIPQA